MSYIVQRVCEFNGVTYFIGDTIPDGVIQEDAAKRLLRMGWITVDQRLGYVEEKVLLEGVFEPDESDLIMVDDIGVKPGDTVKVIWNGVEYTCVVIAPPAESGMSVFFGNEGFVNGEDSGVPFAYATGISDDNGNTESGFITDAEGSVSIKVIGETIHTIDPKYLPGVCLPVVELETVPTVSEDGTDLNEADIAKLRALPDGSVFVAKTILEGMPCSIVMSGIVGREGGSDENFVCSTSGVFQYGFENEIKIVLFVTPEGGRIYSYFKSNI